MDKTKIENNIEELIKTRDSLQKEIIQLDDEILYQGFGVYQPQYEFADLDMYKEKLKEIKNKQKEMIINRTAVIVGKHWIVQGSIEKGKKLVSENVKQMIRNFNIECDLCIDKVKFNNYENIKNRIFKAYELQNDLNQTNELEIADAYYKLKIEELNLSFEYQQQKKKQKDEWRAQQQLLREEEKVRKEIENKRKNYEKEQHHYQNVLNNLEQQIHVEHNEERKNLLLTRQEELKNHLLDINEAMQDLDYREANQKAGYVYIISNIGAFGEDVYKIGMTRRLDPLDRISELSGASVPFKFDVHAMIFSDNAPKLEAALHNAFANKKLNLVNNRKEFFKVKLEEIKKVVEQNYDKTVEFINIPEAEQFRTSEMIRRRKYDI